MEAQLASAQLTILGASPAWTNPGGAGSGYLLRSGGTALQVETGSGTFGRLRAFVTPADLTAVLISHMHGDHFLDLVPLCYGLRYGGLRPAGRLPVYLPPNGVEHLREMGTALNGEADFFSNVFDLREYEPDREFTIGELTVRPHLVRHYIPAYALRFSGAADLVFSGDSAPCDELVQVARGTKTFLCEAALCDGSQDNPDPRQRGHLSAAEAGQIAASAGVQRLVITHYRADVMTREEIANQARAHFPGTLVVARESQTYRL